MSNRFKVMLLVTIIAALVIAILMRETCRKWQADSTGNRVCLYDPGDHIRLPRPLVERGMTLQSMELTLYQVEGMAPDAVPSEPGEATHTPGNCPTIETRALVPDPDELVDDTTVMTDWRYFCTSEDLDQSDRLITVTNDAVLIISGIPVSSGDEHTVNPESSNSCEGLVGGECWEYGWHALENACYVVGAKLPGNSETFYSPPVGVHENATAITDLAIWVDSESSLLWQSDNAPPPAGCIDLVP